jgi:hypothetical protein
MVTPDPQAFWPRAVNSTNSGCSGRLCRHRLRISRDPTDPHPPRSRRSRPAAGPGLAHAGLRAPRPRVAKLRPGRTCCRGPQVLGCRAHWGLLPTPPIRDAVSATPAGLGRNRADGTASSTPPTGDARSTVGGAGSSGPSRSLGPTGAVTATAAAAGSEPSCPSTAPAPGDLIPLAADVHGAALQVGDSGPERTIHNGLAHAEPDPRRASPDSPRTATPDQHAALTRLGDLGRRPRIRNRQPRRPVRLPVPLVTNAPLDSAPVAGP